MNKHQVFLINNVDIVEIEEELEFRALMDKQKANEVKRMRGWLNDEVINPKLKKWFKQ